MLEEGQNTGQKRCSYQDGDNQGLDSVRQKGPEARPVEPEALLDHENSVSLKGNREDAAAYPKSADVDQTGQNRSVVQRSDSVVQKPEASAQPEGQGRRQENTGRNPNEPGARPQIVLSPGVTLESYRSLKTSGTSAEADLRFSTSDSRCRTNSKIKAVRMKMPIRFMNGPLQAATQLIRTHRALR